MRRTTRTHGLPTAMCASLVVTVLFGFGAGAASSPYPPVMTMQHGLEFSSIATHYELPWGTRLTAAQARWVTIRSSGSAYRWGVWKDDGGPPTFPVRSTDGGTTWTEAGPQLATDWAGGGLFYVSRVLPEGPSAVVMVSNSVIDVTTDGGHQWYQYLNADDNWSVTSHPDGAAISIRVGPTSYSNNLPKQSYAIYVLNVARHQWLRTRESLS